LSVVNFYPIFSTRNRVYYADGDIINAYFKFFNVMFFDHALNEVTAKICPKNEDGEEWAINESDVITNEDGHHSFANAFTPG